MQSERVGKVSPRVQFVIYSCRILSQSNYLGNTNKDCDWLIIACFTGDYGTQLTPLLLL